MKYATVAAVALLVLLAARAARAAPAKQETWAYIRGYSPETGYFA